VGRAVLTGRRSLAALGGEGRVVVSTEDEEIAAVARQYRAEVPFVRPAELARDLTPSAPVVLHAIDWYAERGVQFDEVVLLPPTTPLKRPEDVLGCIRLFRDLGGPAVVAVTEPRDPIDHHYVMQGTRLEGVSGAQLFWNRQDRTPEVRLATSVYVCSPAWLREKGHWLVPGETHGYRVPAERAFDIDSEFGLLANEVLHRRSLPWGRGRVMIVAEAGLNHNGDFGRACRMVEVAAEAGADAVKFQMCARLEKVISPLAGKAAYQSRNTGNDESQLELMSKLHLPFDSYPALRDHCRERGIEFLATAFDRESVDLLSKLGVTAVKIASGEITNHPFLEYVSAKQIPLIVSTGMSDLAEVHAALRVIRSAGNHDVALLHCVSNYPAEPAEVNLMAMRTMETAFGVPVGYSDHTLGTEVAVAAAALGARLIEKHFTLDRNLPGPDHRASLEPDELASMARQIRAVEAAMGGGEKEPAPGEADTAAAVRRSLLTAVRIPAGTVLTADMLEASRPGTGLPPSAMTSVVGRQAKVDIPEGKMIDLSDLS